MVKQCSMEILSLFYFMGQWRSFMPAAGFIPAEGFSIIKGVPGHHIVNWSARTFNLHDLLKRQAFLANQWILGLI